MKTNRSQSGQMNGNAKLTEEQVKYIKSTWPHIDPAKNLAERFNVCVSTIHRIRQGRGWDKVVVNKTTKRCPKCNKEKSLEMFQKDRSQALGVRSICKECRRIEQREYRKTPKGKEHDRRNAISPRSRYNYTKHSARKRRLEFCLEFEEYKQLIAQTCHYCGGELNNHGTGLDRVDNNKGYVHGNVVPCCKDCNTVKSDIFNYKEMLLISKVIRQIKNDRLVMALGVQPEKITEDYKGVW